MASPDSARNTSRKQVLLIVALLSAIAVSLATPSIAQTVTISQPANNSTVSSSVQVVAKASDSNGIKYTQIYVDGSAKYTVNSSYVNTTLSLSSGTHRIAVQATDTLGNHGKSVVYVTVSSTTNLTTFTRIEEQSDWQTCGNCGNTGATGATATYSMTRGISSPSLDGSSSSFSIGGSYTYKNAYWYIGDSPGPTKPVQYLRYEFYLYVPGKYVNAPQAIEFECQQKANGYVYNFAWQANYAGNQWRIFDYVLRRWDSTGISLTRFSGDKWHHIIAEYHTDGTSVVHDALTIDGVRHVVGIKHPGKYVGGTSHYLTNAFQLDLNGSATPYKVYVDGMKVSYK
ncbi:MAG: Ig-like domain-containing protein [Terriglobia bacterium]|nr:Ig-like domain-containing protein [Terriglobia bacterium]